ncbi:NACHT domain-containing protein [Streptomyces albicerus]|uniref:NACHT domain-containing protein n=1 Tax=Streptomyces albicerus TaxID=2569859 RepID=UPI00124B5EF3|nr:NACHT domain-containing protein [Streptomyces albicerus]
MEIGGRRQRRIWQVVLTVGGLAVFAVILWAAGALARGGLERQDIAGVVGLVLATMSLVVAVAALRRRAGQEADTAAAADRLTHKIRAAEGQQWRQLLGGDRVPIDLAYDVVPSGPRCAEPPASLAGRLTKIADDFLGIGTRRLVVTGGPGAGKTVLALRLLLDLTGSADDTVPVRLSLAGWNPRVPFADWLVERLVHDYDREPSVARDLVEHRCILPVLDGLDEMDAPGTDPDSSRAKEAVKTLDAYQDGHAGAHVVVTCRTDWYERLERSGSAVPDAVRVEIRPVAAEQAHAYLVNRVSRAQDGWTRVLCGLTESAPGRPSFLAHAMSTPWRLTLAATAYADRGDPGELLRHSDSDALDEDLLSRYVPAVTRLHSGGSYCYRSDQVHRWLGVLARHAHSAEPAGASTELVPHQLWPLAGARRVRTVDAVLTSSVVLAATAALLLRTDFSLSLTHLPAAFGIAALVLAVLLRAGSGKVPSPQGGKLRRLDTPDGRRLLVHRLRGAGVLVLAIAMVQWVASGLMAVVIAVLAAGLVLSAASAITSRRAQRQVRIESHPRDLLRDDINSGLSFSALFGSVFGAFVGYGSDYVLGIGAGAVGGLVCGMVWWSGAGRRYFVFLLCTRGLLPWRLARFLDWAYGAGLLRISGSAYQFRHQKLQAWLLRHPEPVPTDSYPGGS